MRARLVASPVCGAKPAHVLRHLCVPHLFGGCAVRCGSKNNEKRWPPCGSRRDIPEAIGNPRILLPLCVLADSPASALAPSHCGVARNDGHRTVSYSSFRRTLFFVSLAETSSTSTFRPSRPALAPIRDRIAEQIRTKLNLSKEQLTLAQVLESATWKGGREIAKEKRPESGGPPIEIISDGTVF